MHCLKVAIEKILNNDVVSCTKSVFLITTFMLAVFFNTATADKAPNFSLQGDDSTIELSSFKGKVVYLDFWASWCVPCRQSFPFMNDMHEKYSEEGLKVIAINLDTEREKAKRFIKIIPADFTIAYDAEGKVPELYKLSVVPSFYLINGDGEIVYKHAGFRSSQSEKLEYKIRQVLSENKKSKLSLVAPTHP